MEVGASYGFYSKTKIYKELEAEKALICDFLDFFVDFSDFFVDFSDFSCIFRHFTTWTMKRSGEITGFHALEIGWQTDLALLKMITKNGEKSKNSRKNPKKNREKIQKKSRKNPKKSRKKDGGI